MFCYVILQAILLQAKNPIVPIKRLGIQTAITGGRIPDSPSGYVIKALKRQNIRIMPILNRKPLLYLTLGGVMARGIPIRAKIIVVTGSENH